jgi:hypothetical protein
MTYGSLGERAYPSASRRTGWARRVLPAVVLVVLFTAVVSCGPDSKGKSSGPVPVGAFASAYADAWCNGLEPCCGVGGYAFDIAQCKQSVGGVLDSFVKATSARPHLVFDERVAGVCIEATRHRFASCNDRAGFNAGNDMCDGLFRGTVALGGSCAENEECARVDGSDVRCDAGVCATFDDPFDLPAPTPAAPGEACNSTCSLDPFLSYCEYLDTTADPVGCYEDEGLYCPRATLVCTPLPRVGEPCPEAKCERDAFCQFGTCVAAAAMGPCDSRDQCAHTSRCDVDAGSCVPRKANGAACNDLDECLSASCEGDLCRNWSVATPERCAGLLDG